MISKKNAQSGFSLVELMVVVAIIGILATIAIPSVNKYMAKARQTEAKTNLASLYTSEKAFFSEYNTYDARFQVIGFTPEGGLRYNVGFQGTGAANAGIAHGYHATPTDTSTNAKAYCGAAGAYENGCTMLVGADGNAPPDLMGTTNTQATTFLGGAVSMLTSGGTTPPSDQWTIDEVKALKNSQLGIR